MKYFLILMIALSLTLAWQTSVHANSGTEDTVAAEAKRIAEENKQAGRVPFTEEDCD